MSIVSYLGFPLLFAERRNGALVYSMLFQGSAITSKCVNEYKALEIPTSICLPVCFSFCTLTFSPSVTSLHMKIAHRGIHLHWSWLSFERSPFCNIQAYGYLHVRIFLFVLFGLLLQILSRQCCLLWSASGDLTYLSEQLKRKCNNKKFFCT